MNYIGGNATDWWKLSKKLDSALDVVSDELDTRYKRRLKLGSPVLLPAQTGSMVRAPIIVHGGPRELPVAYRNINDVHVDGRRIKAIAQHMGYRTPSFFGYLAYSLPVLLPVFALATLLFFR